MTAAERFGSAEWHRRNNAVLVRLRTSTHLRLHDLMRVLEPEIGVALQAALEADGNPGRGPLPAEEVRWIFRIALQFMMNFRCRFVDQKNSPGNEYQALAGKGLLKARNFRNNNNKLSYTYLLTHVELRKKHV